MTGLVINHQLESITASSGVLSFNEMTGGILLPIGGTASRPTNVAGFIRFNSESNGIELADGTGWTTLGSGSVNSIVAGTGLSGGTITTVGTLAVALSGISDSMLAQRNATTIMGNPLGSVANAQDIALGTGLVFSGTTLAIGTSGVTAGTYNAALITVDAIGRITLGTTNYGRIRLGTALTLYVASTGTDTNSGLTVGSPLLTVQKAVDILSKNYDLNGNQVTIQLADGTYTSQTNITHSFLGVVTEPHTVSPIKIAGNSINPDNVHVAMVNNTAFRVAGKGANIVLADMKITTPGGGNDCIRSEYGASVSFTNINFGTAGQNHIVAETNGKIFILGAYQISAGAERHMKASNLSSIFYESATTVTLTGTPAFSQCFVTSYNRSCIASRNLFSGSATGTRFQNDLNSVITTNGAGANYYPGSIAGSSTNGAQYE